MGGKVTTAEHKDRPVSVEILKQQCGVPDYIHAGICSRNHWGNGKQVTEAVYRKAAGEFGRLPVGG